MEDAIMFSFDNLPEDIVVEVVSYLTMKERARFRATSRRNALIEHRIGYRRFHWLRFVLVQEECKVYANSGRNVWLFTDSLRPLKSNAMLTIELGQNVAKDFAFFRKAVAEKIMIQVHHNNEGAVNAILSSTVCHNYVFNVLPCPVTKAPHLPDLSKIKNASAAAVSVICFSRPLFMMDFVGKLPRFKHFTFRTPTVYNGVVAKGFLDEPTIYRMASQSQLLNCEFARATPASLVHLFQIVRDCQERKMVRKAVSLWNVPYRAAIFFRADIARMYPGVTAIPGAWLLHEPSGTVVMYSGVNFLRLLGGTFADDRNCPRDRMLIAKVSPQKVVDPGYLRQLWYASYPLDKDVFLKEVPQVTFED